MLSACLMMISRLYTTWAYITLCTLRPILLDTEIYLCSDTDKHTGRAFAFSKRALPCALVVTPALGCLDVYHLQRGAICCTVCLTLNNRLSRSLLVSTLCGMLVLLRAYNLQQACILSVTSTDRENERRSGSEAARAHT